MNDSRRQRLIARMQDLPESKLPEVEQFLDHLECGDSSPLSFSEPRPPAGPLAAKDWPHAPPHRLSDHGTYIVTAGTLYKEHFFRSPEYLDLLESALLRLSKHSGWQLEAWAVFSNHYHFVAHAQAGAEDLRLFLKHLHGSTARELNRLDDTPGRSIWYNFWDTELTFEKSYLVRLNYVHQNAVKHGLVAVANQYRWCSAAWFEATATRAQVNTIYSFKIDKVRVYDDF